MTRWRGLRMRQAFAHDAIVVTAPNGDDGAPGAAITVALCGHWEHEPPCPLAPHHTHAERAGDELRLRTPFVVEPELEDNVRQRIEAALAEGRLVGPGNVITSWRLLTSNAADLVAAEHDDAERLLKSSARPLRTLCPRTCRPPPAGRREALREAKRRLQERKAAARADSDDDDDREPAPDVELDPERFVTRPQGRRAWFREARRELEIQREQQARPIARDRHARLLESVCRLEEELAVEIAASDQYEAHRAARVAAGVPSNRVGGPWKPYTPPEEPEGKVNLTDPDSRNLKISNGYVQGYNAQAVVAENQIVIGAEVEIGPQDFGNLGPMVNAARRELTNVGVTEHPEVVLADSGYWHSDQMDNLADDGIETLIPPDSSKREGPRPGWTGGRYEQTRQLLASEAGAELSEDAR